MNFNTVGIVCEYNPFHFGHKYHIKRTKEITNCQNIICVMSGSMVQRGECAIFDKWQRAKAAIDGGADLVIELPAYYVLQSADIFAYGAVKLLSDTKITDALSFGCECGDIDILKEAAFVMTKDSCKYNQFIKIYLNEGYGYPKASELALLKCMPHCTDIISKPNNTLAIGYIKAIDTLNSNITPMCIKRDNDYHGGSSNDNYLSASEIRNMILNGDTYASYAPDFSNENIYNMKNAESFILGFLRTLSPDNITSVKGSEDGLSNLVIASAKRACTLEELYTLCTSKRYTVHRIKRYIMSVILGIDYDEDISYVRVLAMNDKGRELLRQIKSKSNLSIITKAADYKGKSKMFETDIKSTDIAALCSDDISKRKSGKDYTTSPYIK